PASGGVPPWVVGLRGVRGASHPAGHHRRCPERDHVSLAVYDPAGRRVRMLVAGGLEPGAHEARFDGTDDGGRRLTNGLYFVRLMTTARTLTARVAVME